jgi:serine/threonine-protein kinase HipA
MSMLGSKAMKLEAIWKRLTRSASTAPRREPTWKLWRRLVFNILISNTDDHLRNHGFLYEGQAGWRLSPAYDINPVPTDIKPRILSTAINQDDNTASLALAVEVAGYFDLDDGKARDIAKQVGKAVSKWRDEAARHGLNKAEMDRMASAFEHEDRRATQQGGSAKV